MKKNCIKNDSKKVTAKKTVKKVVKKKTEKEKWEDKYAPRFSKYMPLYDSDSALYKADDFFKWFNSLSASRKGVTHFAVEDYFPPELVLDIVKLEEKRLPDKESIRLHNQMIDDWREGKAYKQTKTKKAKKKVA